MSASYAALALAPLPPPPAQALDVRAVVLRPAVVLARIEQALTKDELEGGDAKAEAEPAVPAAP